jgi:hypothetical protein
VEAASLARCEQLEEALESAQAGHVAALEAAMEAVQAAEQVRASRSETLQNDNRMELSRA